MKRRQLNKETVRTYLLRSYQNKRKHMKNYLNISVKFVTPFATQPYLKLPKASEWRQVP